MSLQDLEHSRFEVIVDRHAWHTSPELKGMALAEQKGFLPLRGETFDKHRPRKAEPPSQERDFDQLAPKLDGCFAKVKLCPLPRRKVERNVGRLHRLAQLLHKETHGRFCDGNAQLA